MVDILDTKARTRERFEAGPFSTQVIGREALKRWVIPLARHMAKQRCPKGLESVLRGLSSQQLALLALRCILDRIHAGWDIRGKKRKRKIKNPDMWFCLELGHAVRYELEFKGLRRGGKKYVKAAKDKVGRRIRLGKLHKLEWTNIECARVGDWLWGCLSELSCFDVDERGFPKIADDHKAALGELAEELVFKHPLYMPSLSEPPPWTSWRTEYDDRIGANFVKADHPETIESIKTAFADGSIEPHALGVSAVQRVPLAINPVTLSLLREFGGEEYRRDIAVAEALQDQPFWNLIRCDFRGRLIHLCDFNYTRGDPVRSLFFFHEGKRLGGSIDWLEIAVANAYGLGSKPWHERHQWVANNKEFIKEVAREPGLIWLQDINDKGEPNAKEPFLFAAACVEYVAADTHGHDYQTHLPVWLDASSNGLQHLAMMWSDRELAEQVNLCTEYPKNIWRGSEAVETIRDIYTGFLPAVQFRLCADHEEYWSSQGKDVLRQIFKRPIMTLPYAVTRSGMLEQIEKEAEKQELKLPRGAAIRLRDILWDTISDKFRGAMACREYIQEIAKRLLERGEFMQWVTVTGFRVCNRYHKSETERIVLPFLGEKVTIADGYTDEPKKKKVINSAVANVVHSMDAAHAMRSVSDAAARGIQALTIHDCYATHAPDVREFARIRRWVLAMIYSAANPLVQLRANLPPGTNDLPLPRQHFDPLAVGYSEYFDR
jgi:DNA-directed RNA polymerase